jgi:GMP synthase (glutamine-hydrolysing)
MQARILIVDGSPMAAQEPLIALGAARSGENYATALRSQLPADIATDALDCFVLAAADGERLPQGMTLGDFDGIAFTGSPLSAYEAIPAVTDQIDLARAAFQSEIPCFGSCWGLQVMAVALGGRVHLNPNGYEVGIARQIRLNDDGRAHAMYAGKASVFDAVCTHQDEVCALPAGAVLLAGNDVSQVQAAVLEDGARSFWGVQYHPEFGLSHVAAILQRRAQRLVNDGLASSVTDVEQMADDFRALEAAGGRRDVAWRYGLGRDVTKPNIHRRELANWLAAKVLPRGQNRA